MRLLRGLLVTVLLLGGFACGDSSTDSIVVATVTAAPDMPAISQLCTTIGIDSASKEAQLFPSAPSAQALVFDASFALVIPRHRQGNLDIVVDALDMGGNVAATGAGSVPIVVGGRTKLTIHLGSARSDAGVPDDGAVDAQDERFADGLRLDTIIDLVGRDGPNASEAGNAEVAIADTAGGSGGAGGAGALDGGVATGGARGGGGLGGWDGPGIDGGGGTGGTQPDGAAGADGNADVPSRDSADGRSDLTFDLPPDVVVIPDAADGSADGGPVACASTVQCPVYPKCRIQPTCDSTLGVCTQPAQCSVCGNGAGEFSEECDDGNTISGDHCSSTCKTESCGDGVVPSYTLAGLSLIYLARSWGSRFHRTSG